jgi:hypothetical protein
MLESAPASGAPPSSGTVMAEPAIRRVPVPDLCALWAETRHAPMNIALAGLLDEHALAGSSGDPATVVCRGEPEPGAHAPSGSAGDQAR